MNGIGDALVDVFLRAVDDSRPRIRAMTEWLAEAAHPPRGVHLVADDGAEFTGLLLVERNRPIMMLALLLCIGELINGGDVVRDAGEIPGPRQSARVFIFEGSSSRAETDSRKDHDLEIDEAVWVPTALARQRLGEHPFALSRALSEAALSPAADGVVPIISFTRRPDGVDVRSSST